MEQLPLTHRRGRQTSDLSKRAAGLHTSRADGAPLAYNQDDVWLPDLLVCRREFAETVTSFVTAYWAEHGQ